MASQDSNILISLDYSHYISIRQDVDTQIFRTQATHSLHHPRQLPITEGQQVKQGIIPLPTKNVKSSNTNTNKKKVISKTQVVQTWVTQCANLSPSKPRSQQVNQILPGQTE
jgi:hypothetical protein